MAKEIKPIEQGQELGIQKPGGRPTDKDKVKIKITKPKK